MTIHKQVRSTEEALSVKQPCCVEDTLKLALEALEKHGDAYLGHLAEYNFAIIKVKEALEQPAVTESYKQSTTCGEPINCRHCGGDANTICAGQCKTNARQPEQRSVSEHLEPVAWNVINPTGDVVATESNAIHGWARIQGYKPTVEGLLGFHEQGWRVVPATTPPYVATPRHRKPLTDEQIKEASLKAGMQEHYMGFHSGFIRFARAIEAVHGIVGDINE